MRSSDIIYLCLNFLLMYWIRRSYRLPYNQKIWIKVFRQSIPSIALGILLVFWLISILDSIIIHHSSLIDKIFYPLNHLMEYSYSKPFDRVLLLPKIKFIDGQYKAVYSHLRYVPLAFKTSADVIHALVIKSFVVASVYFGILFFIWFWVRNSWHDWECLK